MKQISFLSFSLIPLLIFIITSCDPKERPSCGDKNKIIICNKGSQYNSAGKFVTDYVKDCGLDADENCKGPSLFQLSKMNCKYGGTHSINYICEYPSKVINESD